MLGVCQSKVTAACEGTPVVVKKGDAVLQHSCPASLLVVWWSIKRPKSYAMHHHQQHLGVQLRVSWARQHH